MFKKFLMATVFSGFLVSTVFLGGCERIDTGNTGVEVSATGSVSPEALSQGLYFTPLRRIYEVSGKEDTIQLEDMHPKSKDNLTMEDLDIDITIQIDPKKAPAIYVRFSNDLHYVPTLGAYVVGTNYVTRQARAVIYRVIARHDALTMHQHRQELENEILNDLQNELNHDMGPNWIILKNVNVRNLVTDKNVEKSIREIANAQFETRQMIELQKKARETAIKDTIEAEGKANAEAARVKIAAEANAEKMRIEAMALAKANEVIAKSLSPEVLALRQIEALKEFANKGASTVILPSGQSVTPMVNVGK